MLSIGLTGSQKFAEWSHQQSMLYVPGRCGFRVLQCCKVARRSICMLQHAVIRMHPHTPLLCSLLESRPAALKADLILAACACVIIITCRNQRLSGCPGFILHRRTNNPLIKNPVLHTPAPIVCVHRTVTCLPVTPLGPLAFLWWGCHVTVPQTR